MMNNLYKDPFNPDLYFQSSLLYYKKKPEKAKFLLQLCIHFLELSNIKSDKPYLALHYLDNSLQTIDKGLSYSPSLALYNAKGLYFHSKKEYTEAIQTYNKGLTCFNTPQNDLLMLLVNLSTSYLMTYDIKKCEDTVDKAIRLKSSLRIQNIQLNKDIEETLFINQAIINIQKKEYDNAISLYNKALPTCNDIYTRFAALNNIALCYSNLGNNEQCLKYYKQASDFGYNFLKELTVEQVKEVVKSYQIYLLTLNYIQVKEDIVFKAHKEFNKFFNLETVKYKYNHSKIRVGYISCDLGIYQPVTFFLSSIFKHSNFDNYCYSTLQREEYIAKYLKYDSVKFYYIGQMSYKEGSELIKSHEIDILIDLCGHAGGSMLPILLYKPSNIQITYMGYPNTTGIDIDYRIVDHITDNDYSQQFNSEKLLYMPNCFLCFDTSILNPKVNKIVKPYTLFAVMNRIHKINTSLLHIIKKVMDSVQDSKIVFKFNKKDRFNIDKNFDSIIDINRTLFIDRFASYEDYLNFYNEIDICLDTFPYSGTTTTCETLLMDTPVITLYSENEKLHRQNVSSSILMNCNLKDYIATSIEEYVIKVKEKIKVKDNIREKFIKGNNTLKFNIEYEKMLLML